MPLELFDAVGVQRERECGYAFGHIWARFSHAQLAVGIGDG